MDESVKFAWAYLLTHGNLTTGEWSYYGGCWELPKGLSYGDKTKIEAIKDKAVSIGIDWTRTKAPEVQHESEFMDTYSPSRDCLATIGRLHLMDGKSYLIGSDDSEAAALAETARQILQKKESPVMELANKL